MALHEVAAYPHVISLGRRDRVLQQHSLYWAASAYGEIDIALAFGSALVFCEAWGIESVSSAIQRNQATCAGLVPSILGALDPASLPSLRVVFTWGEALQASVARTWAQRLRLVDLLISTECWLSFYADWNSALQSERTSPLFKAVPGTQVRLRPIEDGSTSPADSNTVATELLVAGAMVSPGYTDSQRSAAVFLEEGGVRWYCTRDCVERRGSGFVFAGRADDLVKVGGAWVDVREVQRKLEAFPDVAEAHLCGRDAFVALRSLRPVGAEGKVLPELRRVLPPDFACFVVPALPRRPGTDKVDRRRLTELVSHQAVPSVLEMNARRCDEELDEVQRWYAPLLVLGFGALLQAAWVVQRGDDLFMVLLTGEVAAERTYAMLALSLGFQTLLEFYLRFFFLSYIVLASLIGCGPWQEKYFHHFPFGVHGCAVFLVAVLPGLLCGVPALPGISKALQRGRFLSWPIVCAIGFPLWARSSGTWWARQGCSGIVKWYWQIARGKAKTIFRELKWSARKVLGVAYECNTCKARCDTIRGHVDRTVDTFWYCENCWKLYRKHRECGRCKRWTVRGQEEPETGGWLCWICEPCLLGRSSPKDGRDEDEGEDKAEQNIGNVSQDQKDIENRGQHAPHAKDNGKGDGHFGAKDLDIEKGNGKSARHNGVKPGTGWPNSRGESSNNSDKSAQWIPVEKRVINVSLSSQDDQRERARALRAYEGYHQLEPGTATIAQVENSSAGVAGWASAAQAVETNLAAPVAKSAHWQIIERAVGWSFSSPGDSLSGLDSLRTTKMASALQREAGVRLPRDALRRCATLGALLKEISQLPAEPCPATAAAARGAIVEHAAWGLMWKSKCQWTLRRDRPLSEETVRTALLQLTKRHVALQAELADPMQLFTATQQAFSAFEMWGLRCRRRSAGGFDLESRFARLARQGSCWAFRHAWPRMKANFSQDKVNLVVLRRTTTAEEAKRSLWQMPPFTPPVQVCLVPFGEGAEEGALVHFSVSHMISDGYTLVPLLADFSHLVARAEAEAMMAAGPAAATEGSAAALMLTPLPPVPNAFAALERRIIRTISRDNTFGDLITLDPIGRLSQSWTRRQPVTVLATLPEELVSAIRASGRGLAVPDEIVMLVALGVTLARFEKKATIPVSLIAPQRDGPGESDMIGLFADIRLITVRTEGLSFAGAALLLHHVVKERLWRAPPIGVTYDVPFLNFEWTDFESRHGFAQQVHTKEGNEQLSNPIKVAVDQPNPRTWRMRTAFDRVVYDQDSRERFFDVFEECLCKVLTDPLAPIWPDAAEAKAAVPAAGAAEARATESSEQRVGANPEPNPAAQPQRVDQFIPSKCVSANGLTSNMSGALSSKQYIVAGHRISRTSVTTNTGNPLRQPLLERAG
jgi:hypothetical protein